MAVGTVGEGWEREGLGVAAEEGKVRRQGGFLQSFHRR